MANSIEKRGRLLLDSSALVKRYVAEIDFLGSKRD
jgi:hypothetical protein